MKKRISRSKINLTVDVAMFLAMMCVAGIGLMMKYVLVPGFKRNEIYGKDVELYFLNLDRHEWGCIHLVASFILLFLLLLHILLHWRMICAIVIRMIPGKTIRACIVTMFAIAAFFLGIGPLFIHPQIQPGISHSYRGAAAAESVQPTQMLPTTVDTQKFGEIAIPKKTQQQASQDHPRKTAGLHRENHSTREIELYGSMTLSEVAAKFRIDVDTLADFIHVPRQYANERLGRLKKTYGFDMNDLREYILSAPQ